MKRQEGQDRSLLGAPDRHRHAPFYSLELAEEPLPPHVPPYDHRTRLSSFRPR